MDGQGLITVKSNYSVRETLDRLKLGLESAGLSVFARIDHAANAQAVDMPLRPTDLLIFGSPKGGTPLMQDQQTSGIDLPLKALCWQDELGNVWLSYNDPQWVANRHQLTAKSEKFVAGMGQIMANLAKDATT